MLLDEVPVPVQAPENAFIAKYMKQREQLLKDAQDNKKQVQGIQHSSCMFDRVQTFVYA